MPISATREMLPVIDTEHLDRVTFRDADFRNEVLTLFVRESKVIGERLAAATSDEDWRVAAHTLKGMSRGVGAARLAAVAEEAEQLAATARQAALSPLARHIDEAIGESQRMISGR